MAPSPLRSKSLYHARSVSLPSRLHPVIPQVDGHKNLCRLRASEETFSFRLISGLEDMYNHLDGLLLLPRTQQAFAQQRHEKWLEAVLDGHLRLLDVCTAAKDVSSQTKQDAQDLLSILRRRRDTSDFAGLFLASRKKAKKVIQKSLKDLKSIKSKHTLTGLALDEVHPHTLEIVVLFNEVEAATINMFEPFFSCIAGTSKVQSRPSGFSLVSKLMQRSKSLAVSQSQDEGKTITYDFEKFDALLHSLNGHHKMSKTDIDNVQHRLGKMESSIQDLEEGLECLFRRLIKTRVSLLNILNH